jgi:hypothetical protein
MNLRESFGACLIPEEKPQSDDELDKLFQNFQVDLQNETPPQSVLENLQRHSANGSVYKMLFCTIIVRKCSSTSITVFI